MKLSEYIRCPDCGFCPEDMVGTGTDAPQTYDDLLDFFEVMGCDQGHIMCPVCCEEFVPRKPRRKK